MPAVCSDFVIYTGFGLKGITVITVRSSDIVLLISGSIGALNEFTIAYDEGKVIGVLCGSGGVCDRIEDLLGKLTKKTKSVVVYEHVIDRLLDRCIKAWKERVN